MGSISIREHIRWGTEDPSEPTSTLVLTSLDRHFVDIRILKTALSSTHATGPTPLELPRSSIDWAFGGTSSSSPAGTRPDGIYISHAVFRHWVDSRTTSPEQTVDEGDMWAHPDEKDVTLEAGRMTNPDTGVETDYEERWRDEDPQAQLPNEHVKSLVFQLHDDAKETRGLFVRLGKYAQGVLRVGDVFTAERWQQEGKWQRLFKAGDEKANSLDLMFDYVEKREYRVGDTFDGAGGTWTVMEAKN